MIGALRSWTFALLWVLALTIPWEAALLLPTIGTISRAVGLLVVPLAVVAVIAGGRRRRLEDPHLIVAGLAAWAAASILWSIHVETTIRSAGTMLQLFAMVLLLWEFGDVERRQRQLLWAFVLGATLGAIGLIRSAALQEPVPATEVRFTEGGLNANYAAFVFAAAIPMAWHLSLTSARSVHRWLAGLYVPVGAMAVVLTGSRGGLLTLAVALAIVPVTLRRGGLRLKLFAMAALAASVVAVATFVPPSTIERLGTIPTELTTGDLGSREQVWAAAMQVFASDPLVGVGAGASRFRIDPGVGLADTTTKDPRGPHNTYLSLAADLGVVGLGAFLLLWLSLVGRWRQTRGPDRPFVGVLLATLAIGLIPGHREYDKVTWFLIAVAIAHTARRSTSSERTTPEVIHSLRNAPRPTSPEAVPLLTG